MIGFLVLLLFTQAQASRPVFHDLSREELIERSTFVFTGWPSSQKSDFSCKHEFKRWWVHRVLKGDRSLEKKVISISLPNSAIHEEIARTGRGPSFPEMRFGTGGLDAAQQSSFLFTLRKTDGCFELSASGAQVSQQLEPEIEALFASPGECQRAIRGLQFRAEKMPAHCASDLECEAFAEHPDPCEVPWVWNRVAKDSMDANFRHLQRVVREVCANQFGTARDSCRIPKPPVLCRKGRCEVGIPAEALQRVFSSGTLSPSCAPHDALSTRILITDGKNEYPSIGINWWKQGRPENRPGEYRLRGARSLMEDGVIASFCPSKGVCRQMSRISVRVRLGADGQSGEVEVDAVSDRGEIVKAKVPVKWRLPKEPAVCG
jgi:hypothetical protein